MQKRVETAQPHLGQKRKIRSWMPIFSFYLMIDYYYGDREIHTCSSANDSCFKLSNHKNTSEGTNVCLCRATIKRGVSSFIGILTGKKIELATDGDPIWLPIPFLKKVQHPKGKKNFIFIFIGWCSK